MNKNTKSVLLTIANARTNEMAYSLFRRLGMLGVHQLYLGKIGRFTIQAGFTVAAIYTIVQPTWENRVQLAFTLYIPVIIGLCYDYMTLWWQVRRVNTKIVQQQAQADDNAAKRV